jgi:hypothetical protein
MSGSSSTISNRRVLSGLSGIGSRERSVGGF